MRPRRGNWWKAEFGKIVAFLAPIPPNSGLPTAVPPAFSGQTALFFKVSYHITQPSPESGTQSPVAGSLRPAKDQFLKLFSLFCQLVYDSRQSKTPFLPPLANSVAMPAFPSTKDAF
jgi:hypothetical protein